MNSDEIFKNDFLNCRFNKKDICKVELYELVFSEEYFQVIYLKDAVGFVFEDEFLDFSDGNVIKLIEFDENNIKNNDPGVYALYPVKLYDERGKISPIDVLCDMENGVNEEPLKKVKEEEEEVLEKMKDSVLDSYEKVSLEYIGNSNSLHKLGLNSKKLEDAAGKQILDVLGLRDYEVIYTSGNAESFSTIFLNTKDKVWTDNEDINDIGIEMGLDVSFLGDYSLDKEKCFVSTRNEENSFGKFNHIDISLDNSYSRLNDFDFITIEDDIPFFGVLLKKKILILCLLLMVVRVLLSIEVERQRLL